MTTTQTASTILELTERIETVVTEALHQLDSTQVRPDGYLQAERMRLREDLQGLMTRCDGIRYAAERDQQMPVIRKLEGDQ